MSAQINKKKKLKFAYLNFENKRVQNMFFMLPN